MNDLFCQGFISERYSISSNEGTVLCVTFTAICQDNKCRLYVQPAVWHGSTKLYISVSIADSLVQIL